MQDKVRYQDLWEARPSTLQQQELGWQIDGRQAPAVVQPLRLPSFVPPQKLAPLSAPPRPRFRYQPPAPPSPVRPPARPQAIAPSASPKAATKPARRSPPAPRRRPAGLRPSLLVMLGLGISGGLGVLSLVWLTTLPPMPQCERVSALSPDTEQLYCLREAARSGQVADLKAAVELVQDWTESHPLYAESQQGLTQWSQLLLEMARQRYQDSDLKGALEVAGIVPASSSLYGEAQAAIATWQDEWQQGEALYEQAQTALANQEWHVASAQLLALGQLQAPYWREARMADLTEQIFAERSAWTALLEARRLTRTETADNLVAALTKLEEIDPQTHAWDAAAADRQAWSTALAEMALEAWQRGETADAIALAQAIPTAGRLDAEAANLVRFGHAQRLAQAAQDADWEPSPTHLWQLREAIAALETIPTTSLFYDPAQTALTEWQAQRADMEQLQLASAIAALGQRPALELAVHQAAQVERDRPRRQQAQTLIAHWQQQIERLQDMPLLALARQRADRGTIADLQAAIALALRIDGKRALHSEAEAEIAAWSDAIERIEDQPILDQARQYAAAGDLRRAIREARQIARGRALYADAQAQVTAWQAEIDRELIAADREILDEATALANRDSLTRAIDLAAQIGRDRPLYDEAQSAIAQWRVEREMIWEMWAAEEAAPASAEPGYDAGYGSDPGYGADDYHDPGYDESGYLADPVYYDDPVY